jgi:hypothetical protein
MLNGLLTYLRKLSGYQEAVGIVYVVDSRRAIVHGRHRHATFALTRADAKMCLRSWVIDLAYILPATSGRPAHLGHAGSWPSSWPRMSPSGL